MDDCCNEYNSSDVATTSDDVNDVYQGQSDEEDGFEDIN